MNVDSYEGKTRAKKEIAFRQIKKYILASMNVNNWSVGEKEHKGG